MTRSNDSFHVPALTLDPRTADRLLGGEIHPDDAPPGYAAVAQLVLDATAPPNARELSREPQALAAAVGQLAGDGAGRGPSPGVRSLRSRLLRAKVAALVVVGTLGATTGLAAAGVLPDPAQRVVSHVLSKVGISVPSGDDRDRVDRPAGGAELSPSATAPASGADEEEATSTGTGPAGREGAPAGEPSPTAAATSGTHGGTGTADAASGGASQHGTTNANERSDGRSAAGSGNAAGNGQGGGSPGNSEFGHAQGGGQGNGQGGGNGA